MSKQLSFAEIATQLQEENARLSSLYKYFEKACKDEFGYSIKDIHKILDLSEKNQAKKAQQGQRHMTEQSEVI